MAFSFLGGSEQKQCEKRPEHIDPFSRSLLRLDKHSVTLTGKNVRLAIIDDGFHENIAAFRPRANSRKERFTFEGEEVMIPTSGGDYHARVAAITEGLQHGTAVAAIAAGRDFDGFVEKMLKYPGGVAPEVDVTCFRYRTTDSVRSSAPSQPPTSSLTSSLSSSIPPPPPPTRSKPISLPKFSSASDDSILLILRKISEIKDRDTFDVVSMSVCMDQTHELDEVITKILNQGTLIIAGTSNEGGLYPMGYPACLPGVVSVGSLNEVGYLSGCTIRDKPYCDVYTYGEVYVPNGEDLGKPGKELPKIIQLKGASFATPAVAGLTCLAIEYAKGKGNDMRIHRKNTILSFFERKRGKNMYLLKEASKDFIVPIKNCF